MHAGAFTASRGSAVRPLASSRGFLYCLVLKKWLSYRESKILDRPLRPEEAQHFTDATRRITAIIQLDPRLMP